MKKFWSITLGVLVVAFLVFLLFNLNTLVAVINDLVHPESPDMALYDQVETEFEEEMPEIIEDLNEELEDINNEENIEELN